MMPTGSRRLDSWKAIAAHLGRDVRTVSRWERDRGLPVHRVPGGSTRTVFAFTHELDEWLKGSGDRAGEVSTEHTDVRSRRPGFLVVAGTGAAVLLVAALILMLSRPSPAADIHSIALEGQTLIAHNRRNAVTWRFDLPVPVPAAAEPERWSVVAELDSRDGVDVAIAPPSTWDAADRLLLLDNQGRLQWQREQEGQLRFGGEEFGPPWRTSAIAKIADNGTPRLAWALHHHTWWPSMVSVRDLAGAEIGRFVNPGWITSVAPSLDRRWLLAAGVNNAERAEVLALLDPASPSGRAPHTSEARFHCENCPSGSPAAYYVFERPEAARVSDAGMLPVAGEPPRLVVLPDGRVQFHVFFDDRARTVVDVIYELSPTLEFRGGRPSERYWAWHRQLEAAGMIGHAAVDCPERRGLGARVWTAGGGWSAAAY